MPLPPENEKARFPGLSFYFVTYVRRKAANRIVVPA
jgi:hypothetical protein